MKEHECSCEDLKGRIRHLELLLRESEADGAKEYYRGIEEGKKIAARLIERVLDSESDMKNAVEFLARDGISP